MKLYILVRTDLSQSQQAVQAGHAVAEFLLHGSETVWENGILVYLGVDDLDKLNFWANKLNRKDVTYSTFYEPDLNNEPTALAAVHDGRIFRNLKLL